MKKFLIFCVACVVTVSIALMTYKFLSQEETLSVNQTVFEINKGEEVPLVITREHEKPGTVITFESLDEDIVYYDVTLGKFFAKAQGGKARLRITSSAKGAIPIMISVTVGDGTEACPYFVRDAYDLAQIGVAEEMDDGTSLIKKPLDAYYSLVSDIDLSVYNEGKWAPIGSVDNAFTGVFYGNNHTISGLNIAEATESAGLFAKIGLNAKGINNFTSGLTLKNVNITGSFDFAGALAGVNEGLISRVNVVDSLVSSTKENAIVGSLVGSQSGQIERASVINTSVNSVAQSSTLGGIAGLLESKTSIKALVDRSFAKAVNVRGNSILGGLVGHVKGGLIVNSYSKAIDNAGSLATESNNSNINMGGIAGKIETIGTDLEATIVDCYSTVKVSGSTTQQKRGQLIGYVVDKMNGSVLVANKLFGLYYEASNNENILGIGYVQSIGKVSDRQAELNSYEFVYNNLNVANETARLNNIIPSHKNVINGREKTYNWETSLVWVVNQDDYPTLDVDGAYFDISEITDSVASGFDIRSYADLLTLQEKVNNGTVDYSKPYVIRENIDLSSIAEWIAIGTDEHPFNGTLTCETDENGKPIHTITGLNISASVGNNGLASKKYNGLFGVIGGQGKVSGIALENVAVKSGQYVGAIAGKNYGVVNNCYVNAVDNNDTVETNNVGYNDESVVYVGGAVAYNEGTVSGVKVNGIAVKVLNSTSSEQIYVGGVVAFNLNTVENSSYTAGVSTANQIVCEQKCKTNVGGVVGYNSYLVTNCYVSKLTYTNLGVEAEAAVTIRTHTDSSDSYTGGVVAVNETNARLTKSFAMADVEGTNVGGVVSLTYGKVEESYSVSNLTGFKVGGITYMLAHGEITDCYTGGTLFGTSKDANKAGFAYEIALESQKDRTCAMKHCFSYNSFDGVGTNFFEVHHYDQAHTIRTDTYTAFVLHYERNCGYVFDSIFDYSVGGDAKRSNKKTFDWDWVDWKSCDKIISDYNSDRNYYSYQEDTGMTTEQIKSEDGANVFRTYGFDENIWKLGDGEYPTLRRVVKA